MKLDVASIVKSDIENRILGLCESVFQTQGYRALDVDCSVGRRSMVRIFVDVAGHKAHKDTVEVAEPVAKSVTLDDCAKLSSLLGPALEVEDLFTGPYDLEVSSPGLDRRLRLSEDFQDCVGEEIQFRFTERLEGLGAKMRARLLSVRENDLLVKWDNKEVALPFQKIRRANLIWRFEKNGQS